MSLAGLAGGVGDGWRGVDGPQYCGLRDSVNRRAPRPRVPHLMGEVYAERDEDTPATHERLATIQIGGGLQDTHPLRRKRPLHRLGSLLGARSLDGDAPASTTPVRPPWSSASPTTASSAAISSATRRSRPRSPTSIPSSGFRDQGKRLDTFDFDFNKKMPRALAFELATARWVARVASRSPANSSTLSRTLSPMSKDAAIPVVGDDAIDLSHIAAFISLLSKRAVGAPPCHLDRRNAWGTPGNAEHGGPRRSTPPSVRAVDLPQRSAETSRSLP